MWHSVVPLFNETEAYTIRFSCLLTAIEMSGYYDDDVNASVRLVDLEDLPSRIIADGIPMFSGRVVTEKTSPC